MSSLDVCAHSGEQFALRWIMLKFICIMFFSLILSSSTRAETITNCVYKKTGALVHHGKCSYEELNRTEIHRQQLLKEMDDYGRSIQKEIDRLQASLPKEKPPKKIAAPPVVPVAPTKLASPKKVAVAIIPPVVAVKPLVSKVPLKKLTTLADPPANSPPSITIKPPIQVQTDPASVGSNQQGAGVSCSTITGRNISSSSSDSCLQGAKWTQAQPYNHTKTPVTFHPFRGSAINIPMGYSLWSVPDHSSTGRHLEAKLWGNQPKAGGKCSNEYTDATVIQFEVRIECEIARQEKLRKEFEEREDNYPSMDVSDCRAPWTVRITDGWQEQRAVHWNWHPEEPIGCCDGPVRDNRQDHRPLREPKWHTAKECADDLSAQPLMVNKRGVRGCKFRGE